MFAMPLPNHVEHRIEKRYLELYVTLNIEKLNIKQIDGYCLVRYY